MTTLPNNCTCGISAAFGTTTGINNLSKNCTCGIFTGFGTPTGTNNWSKNCFCGNLTGSSTLRRTRNCWNLSLHARRPHSSSYGIARSSAQFCTVGTHHKHNWDVRHSVEELNLRHRHLLELKLLELELHEHRSVEEDPEEASFSSSPLAASWPSVAKPPCLRLRQGHPRG